MEISTHALAQASVKSSWTSINGTFFGAVLKVTRPNGKCCQNFPILDLLCDLSLSAFPYISAETWGSYCFFPLCLVKSNFLVENSR